LVDRKEKIDRILIKKHTVIFDAVKQSASTFFKKRQLKLCGYFLVEDIYKSAQVILAMQKAFISMWTMD